MSTVVQTTYRPQIAQAFVGMVADMVGSEPVTRVCETAAGIGFGLAVSQGTGDKGAIIGGAKFLGISIRDITLVPGSNIDPLATGAGAAADIYSQYANMGILTRGHIWVMAGSDVVAGDALFYEQTGGNLSNSASGTAAFGSITFTAIPTAGQTVTINGDVWTFEASGESGLQSNIQATLGDTLAHLVTRLNASGSANTAVLKYAVNPPSPGGAGEGSGANQIVYADKTVGTAGNSLLVTTNVTGATVTGPSGALQGGTAAATAIAGGYWLSSALAGQLAKVSLGIQR